MVQAYKRARVSRDRYEGGQIIICAKNEKCDCGRLRIDAVQAHFTSAFR